MLRLILPALLFAAVLLTACGSNDSDVKTIDQALAADEGSELSVSGFLIVEVGGRIRLCSQLLESSPPQCGGDRIEMFGLDVDNVPDTERASNSSVIPTLVWTNDPITVTGIRTSEGLGTARLSGGT